MHAQKCIHHAFTNFSGTPRTQGEFTLKYAPPAFRTGPACGLSPIGEKW